MHEKKEHYAKIHHYREPDEQAGQDVCGQAADTFPFRIDKQMRQTE
jgi:hypothetical protein